MTDDFEDEMDDLEEKIQDSDNPLTTGIKGTAEILEEAAGKTFEEVEEE